MTSIQVVGLYTDYVGERRPEAHVEANHIACLGAYSRRFTKMQADPLVKSVCVAEGET